VLKPLKFLFGLCSAISACAVAGMPPTALNPLEPNKPMTVKSNLPDLGPAADFNNSPWINTDTPLTLSALRGKVILVEFWTFG
jgi:hypothetical protein